MADYIAPIQRLIEEFRRLPGVGGKTAARYAFAMLDLSEEEAASFADAVYAIKRDVHKCPVCFGLSADAGYCDICKSDSRDGSVICVETGGKLIHQINYRARLIEANEYGINNAELLYGFIAGILASNHDALDIFVDSALKICGNDVEGFEKFVCLIDRIAEKNNINFVITSSISESELPQSLKKYL